ncbi:MAG: F0F1 ATP synthase subunit gamma [Wolbachia endosymbiont of Meromenopon meropis]|nr:F0F1 ATP synthase subunit gamma [Wolbachia endosymbiont of Meromenopon meropis]
MRSLKELSLKIKNIRSVQKTTKIMQMVSAARLAQNQKKLSSSKLYISKLHAIISSLVSAIDQESLANILNTVHDSSYLIFVIASDRGLCASFNSAIVKFNKEYVDKLIVNDKKVNIVFWGKKAFDMSKDRLDSKNILEIENSRKITLKHIEYLIDNINLSQFNRIEVLYSKFYNTFMQKPTLETIKPFSKNSYLIDSSLANSILNCDYQYEPQNADFFLRSLIQNYVIAVLYSALLESSVSENSARMIAMESANRNAKKILNELTLLYNRSRQATITTDLIEIISGAESL